MRKLGCGCFSILFLFFAIIISISFFAFMRYEKPRYRDIAAIYIKENSDLAVNIGRKYGLYPSVILAQSGLESNWGTSGLSKTYNNYFGIKANKNEDSVNLETEEFIDGQSQEMLEPFRRYKSKADSFKHYGELLTKAERYKKVKSTKDYVEAAREIKNAGYATDPNYDKKIVDIIEAYGLDKYDKITETY